MLEVASRSLEWVESPFSMPSTFVYYKQFFSSHLKQNFLLHTALSNHLFYHLFGRYYLFLSFINVETEGQRVYDLPNVRGRDSIQSLKL